MTSCQDIDIWNVWQKRVRLPGTDLSLQGFSRAALKTNFFIPELNIMLDAGLSSPYAPSHMFITHAHGDHCGHLPLSLLTSSKRTIQVYIPEPSAEKLKQYVESLSELTRNEQEMKRPNRYLDLKPVSAHSVIEMTLVNRNFRVDVIECFHSVPCVGYGFSEIKNKLNSEWAGKTSKEIGDLKKSGVEVTHSVICPVFVYVGDTDHRVLSECKTLFQYPIIMIECTFILDEDLPQVERTKHIHWQYLKPYVVQHPNITFILFHFSQRYCKQQVLDFFVDQSKNIIVWI